MSENFPNKSGLIRALHFRPRTFGRLCHARGATCWISLRNTATSARPTAVTGLPSAFRLYREHNGVASIRTDQFLGLGYLQACLADR